MNGTTLLIVAVVILVALLAFALSRRDTSQGQYHRQTGSKPKRLGPLERYTLLLMQADDPKWLWRVREAWLPAPIPELKRLLMAEMLSVKKIMDEQPGARAVLEAMIDMNNPAGRPADLQEYFEQLEVAYVALGRYVPLMTESQERMLEQTWRTSMSASQPTERRMRAWVGPEGKLLGRYFKESAKRSRRLYDELAKRGLSEPWSDELSRKTGADLERRWGIKMNTK